MGVSRFLSQKTGKKLPSAQAFSSFESIKCADLWKIMVNIGFAMKLCFLLFQIIFEQLPNDLVEFHGYS